MNAKVKTATYERPAMVRVAVTVRSWGSRMSDKDRAKAMAEAANAPDAEASFWHGLLGPVGTERLKTIARWGTRVRTITRRHVLEVGDGGGYVMPASRVVALQEALEPVLEQWREAVDSFMAIYDDEVDNAAAALGDLYDNAVAAGKYPPRERLRQQFEVSVLYTPIEVPDYRNLPGLPGDVAEAMAVAAAEHRASEMRRIQAIATAEWSEVVSETLRIVRAKLGGDDARMHDSRLEACAKLAATAEALGLPEDQVAAMRELGAMTPDQFKLDGVAARAEELLITASGDNVAARAEGPKKPSGGKGGAKKPTAKPAAGAALPGSLNRLVNL